MSDKATPGSNVSRSSVPIDRRVASIGGMTIEPDDLRAPNSGQDAWMEGVNTTPKAPRTDPETYDYQAKRP